MSHASLVIPRGHHVQLHIRKDNARLIICERNKATDGKSTVSLMRNDPVTVNIQDAALASRGPG
jgi:hypothetical protein